MNFLLSFSYVSFSIACLTWSLRTLVDTWNVLHVSKAKLPQRPVSFELPEQTDMLQKKLSELQNTRFGKNMLIDTKGRKLHVSKKG